MNFGIPKELPIYVKIPECRVGLSPMGVKELTDNNAKVYVESGAGDGAGFPDAEYENVGASIVYSKEEAYRRSDVVMKVKLPQEAEYNYIRENQLLMGFFHLSSAPKELIKVFKDRQNTVIGYEKIQRQDGRFPIVIPISEIAGKLSVQLASKLLESPAGRGILLGSVPGIPQAEVVILGAGTLGRNAAKSFSGIGANVYVIDVNRDRLEFIATHMDRVTTLCATKQNLEKVVKFADVIIGAIFISGKKTPTLITKEMVKSMRKGTVIIDFSIDNGGCVETSRITPLGEFSYTVDGVIHFCMPNSTTLVARTATHALTGALIPYLGKLVRQGIDEALKHPEINGAIYINNGKFKDE